MNSQAALSWYDGFFKIPELRKRLWFTFVLLVIYRIGVYVPTPGVDSDKLASQFSRGASGNVFGMINMFSGGAWENFSVFALGIMPYISVSIIIQLLTTMIPRLEELSKEGDSGRRVIVRYTRMGTVLLALFQGTMIGIGLESQGVVMQPGWLFRITAAVTLTAGTTFIMWLGEQISERGIGNGISLIIFAGIVARMPATIGFTLTMVSSGELGWFALWGLMLFAVATVAFIVFVETSQRKIPVQYPRRAVGRQVAQVPTQHLPLKLNSAGVIPAIFASTLLFFPATISGFITDDSAHAWLRDIVSYLVPPAITHYVAYSLLVIFFCYFYTAIIFDPNKIAENLKKNGGFVPAVRPGRDTAVFLNSVLSRLTIWGGIYMCIVCIVPSWFYQEMGAGPFAAFFGGTAVLIVVGVTMDTISQIRSHIVARNYEEFMSRGPGKTRGVGRGGFAGQGRLILR